MCRNKLVLLLGFLNVEEFRARSVVILHYTLGIYKLTATDTDSSFYCWISHSSHRHLKRTFLIIKQTDFHSDTRGEIENLTLSFILAVLTLLLTLCTLLNILASFLHFYGVLIFLDIACLMPFLTASSALALPNEQMNKLETAFYWGRLVLWESWWKAWRKGSFGGKEGYVLLWKLVRHLGINVGKERKRI